jgi:two-component sensor histidine kinase
VLINWVSLVRRGILAEKTMLENVAWTAVAVALPALLRFVVDQGQSGIPFVTFFPAMLLIAMFVGWKFAVLTALFNAVVANRLFTPDPVLFYDSGEAAVLVAFYAVTCALVIGAGGMLRSVVREQDAAARREDLLERDRLRRHRNLLAMVQSLARLTARHGDPDNGPEVFDKRVWALGKGGEFQRLGDHGHCNLAELVAAVIAPLRDAGNFALDGPDCPISPEACIPLALALHELGANAAKHGALSVTEGRVNVTWARAAEYDTVVLRWTEQGGPPVAAKPKTGTGSVLLQPQGGLRDVRLKFEPGGVECELVIEGAATS